MTIQIQITVENADQFDRFWRRRAEFAEKMMFEIGREAMGQVKEDIQDEVRGQYYLADGRDWTPTRQFGRLPANRPALQSFARKWAGAPVKLSAKEASIQISAPGAGAHVGGSGLQRSRTVTAIRSRGNPRAMQGAIYRKTGARVSRSTLVGIGLQLPSRPHANPDNPVTARKVEVIMKRGFERGL